jgi:hypothetical protein
MLNIPLLTKWADTLESGSYRQTRGRLRTYRGKDKTHYSYCCLGVLCNIVDKNGWKQLKYNDFERLLPLKTKKSTGLTFKQLSKLMDLNDSEDYSFKQIAEHIRKEIINES